MESDIAGFARERRQILKAAASLTQPGACAAPSVEGRWRVEVVRRQRRVVTTTRTAVNAPLLGLYLHIPFCAAICNYCNFNRGLLDPVLKQRYVEALIAEIRSAAEPA